MTVFDSPRHQWQWVGGCGLSGLHCRIGTTAGMRCCIDCWCWEGGWSLHGYTSLVACHVCAVDQNVFHSRTGHMSMTPNNDNLHQPEAPVGVPHRKLWQRGLTRTPASHPCRLLPSAQANSVLEVLLLNGNNIGEDGARHLVVALHVNKSLHYLGLQGSNLSGEGGGAIRRWHVVTCTLYAKEVWRLHALEGLNIHRCYLP